MESTNYPVGFHSKRGTLREVLARGCELTFEKDGIEYNLDNGILDETGTGKRILEIPGAQVEKVLKAKVNGITVEEMIQTSYVKSIH